MSEEKKELFTDRRWTNPPKATIIDHFERSEEEPAADKKRFREHLPKIGVLKDEQKDD